MSNGKRELWRGQQAPAGHVDYFADGFKFDSPLRRGQIMGVDYTRVVSARWRELLRWDELSEDLQQQIGRFAVHQYDLGKHVSSEISEIKYDGRLIILEDGSRWEVDSMDVGTSEFWQTFSKVVIIDGEMFNIEDAEKVAVQEEA
jgi:hypothetical protein